MLQVTKNSFGPSITGWATGIRPGPIAATGPGARLLWYPSKAAFRAGAVSGTQWDDASIGSYSTAIGRNAVASAQYSLAMGYSTFATGTNSTAALWNSSSSPASFVGTLNFPTGTVANVTIGGIGDMTVGHFCHAVQDLVPDADGTYLSVQPPDDDADPEDKFSEVQMYWHANQIHDWYANTFDLHTLDFPLMAVTNAGMWLDPDVIPPGMDLEGGWQPFEENVKRVLPGAKFFDMHLTDPIFHSFFDIKALDDFPQAYTSGQPVFKGVYEDNDPRKRMLMIVNYNTDVSQFWEWSGRGFRPFDDTNEAYKLEIGRAHV